MEMLAACSRLQGQPFNQPGPPPNPGPPYPNRPPQAGSSAPDMLSRTWAGEEHLPLEGLGAWAAWLEVM
eukprot:2570152-Amphidinium_carterae.1